MEIAENAETGKTYLRCRFATGQRIIPKGTDDDITCDEVAGPESLGKIAIDIHGGLRGQRLPNGNAWKVIRLIRKNQDLGTVWDVRQAIHFNDTEKGPPPKKARKETENDDAYTNGKPNARSSRTTRNR